MVAKLRPALFTIAAICILALFLWQPVHDVPAASAQFRTPTFTPTPTRVGPSPTPTATLLPPPANSGRVAVDELAIRSGPGEEFPVIGGLVFGDIVMPAAIDVGGVWVAIEMPSGQIGWVSSNLLEWDPALDFNRLPLLEPTPIPDGFFLTGTPDSNGPTLTPTATITSVPSATPIPEVEDEVPEAEAIEETAETVTPAVAAILPSATPSEQTPQTEAPSPEQGSAATIDSRIVTYAGLGIGAVALAVFSALYSQRRTQGRKELTRYVNGFPIENCPICRVGSLQLDEKVSDALGIPNIARAVRCNNCRSMLRELEPGVWRYTIDPYVNPQMAYKYNTQRFTDADLLMLVQEAQQYEPVLEQAVEGDSDRAKEAEDIVDLLPEIEPLISEIEKAQEEELQRLLAEEADPAPEAEPPTGDSDEENPDAE